ncbi:quercetin 2,3-dioxygenase [Actinoplanes sp. NPDC023936]|uniref:quercetin 2,3-dioxygenase n=1 Tax=Actinoplanes sp. NPDC023936 TaxID=3154910 RepID=UPI0033F656F2
MSIEYLAGNHRSLPGSPQPYFLAAGEGEHAKLFADTFTVLLSGDETDGQFGMFTNRCAVGDIIPTHSHADTHETFYIVEGLVRLFVELPDGEKTNRLLGQGDFGFVPAGAAHAYRVEKPSLILGAATGGFERFFQQMGMPVASAANDGEPYVPPYPRMQAAAEAHNMRFIPDARW